jgi:hypothetical protein
VSPDPFEEVRAESDALRQARRATELMAVYQQRGIELARVRREAIERAARETGMSFTAVAAALGLSKGRISQIRRTAPPAERILFGVGPLTIAVPLRSMPGRDIGVIAAEDNLSAQRLTDVLEGLQFEVRSFQIPTSGEWDPVDGAIAICGPKSSRVTAEAIDSDPWLSFQPDEDGRWVIRDRETHQPLVSPLDRDKEGEDIAYVGRLAYQGGTLFVIAGVHAMGSLGAVEYISEHLEDLYQRVGPHRFSMVVRSRFQGDKVIETDELWPAQVHP